MTEFARAISLGFASGAAGASAKMLFIWLLVMTGLSSTLGLALQVTPGLQAFFLRLTSGGLWGLLLPLPWLDRRPFWRTILLAMLMTAWEGVITLAPGGSNVVIGFHFDVRQVMTLALFNVVWASSAVMWYRWVR